jgi:hypothetical protein
MVTEIHTLLTDLLDSELGHGLLGYHHVSLVCFAPTQFVVGVPYQLQWTPVACPPSLSHLVSDRVWYISVRRSGYLTMSADLIWAGCTSA